MYRQRVATSDSLKVSEASEPISLTSAIFCLVLASCFVPVSLETPVGFLSVCDLTLLVATVHSVAATVYRGRLQPADLGVVVLAGLSVGLAAISQAQADLAAFSPILKFIVFLVVVPAYLICAGTTVVAHTRPHLVCLTVTSAAVLLCLITLLQVVTGATVSGAEGTYYLVMFGQVVNKNAIGLLSLFGTVSAAWLAFVLGRRLHLVSIVLIISASLVIGARTATLVDVLAVATIYGFFPRPELRRLAILAGLCALMLPLAIWLSPHVPQLSRLSAFLLVSDAAIGSTTARLMLWDYALNQLAQSPWLGFGYDNFRYPGETWFKDILEPHNNLLQLAYAGGWLGVSSFALLLLVGLGKRMSSPWAVVGRLMLAAYLIGTLGDIVWLRHSGHLFWLIFFALALPMPHAARNSDGDETGSTGQRIHSHPEAKSASAVQE